MSNEKHSGENRIEEIKRRLKELPKGYVSRKVISGKERFYLQWRDRDRIKSRYIKDSERDGIFDAIAERKALQAELDTLMHGSFVSEDAFEYKTVPAYYLKWKDDVVGEISGSFAVRFVSPDLNGIVKEYAPASGIWSKDEFTDFLRDRVVSPSRRDIESILGRCGLKEYDVMELALVTHAVSARDLFWISKTRDGRFEDAVTEVFDSIFNRNEDLTGDSVDTPEGQNIKRYGVYNGNYGIYKKRLSPVTADVESELAVCGIARLLGVPCCPCYRIDDDTVFSGFEYDFAKEYIVHFRQILGDAGTGDYLPALISARPGYLKEIARMVALDFITRQDDRHLSNIAVKVTENEESFYPLYDNGRSLFYEDTEETVMNACRDIMKFSTSFGPSGSYYDHVRKLSGMGISFGKILRLDFGKGEIRKVLIDSGFTGYRLEGSEKWITSCLDILKDLS